MDPLLGSLYTDLFTIKKTVWQTTSGKATKILSTVSTGNRGRFEPVPGDERGGLEVSSIGKNKDANEVLFTGINTNLVVGHVVIKESDSVEYDILRVGQYKYFDEDHHSEVMLKERSDSIS